MALSLPFAWLRPVKNLGSSLSPPSQLLQHVASCNFSLEWFGPGILMSRCSGAFRCVPAPAHLNQTTQSPLQHSVKFSRVWLRCVKGLSLCLFRLWRATGPTSESPQRHHGPFTAPSGPGQVLPSARCFSAVKSCCRPGHRNFIQALKNPLFLKVPILIVYICLCNIILYLLKYTYSFFFLALSLRVAIF